MKKRGEKSKKRVRKRVRKKKRGLRKVRKVKVVKERVKKAKQIEKREREELKEREKVREKLKKEKKSVRKKKRGWFAERKQHRLAAKGVKVRKKELTGYKYIYGILFMIGLALAVAAFLKKDLLSLVIAAVTSILSIIFYAAIAIRKRRVEFMVLYVLVWIAALVFAVLSVLKKNFLSFVILVVVMFFTSLTSSLMVKRLRKGKIISVVRELSKKRKRTETDIDNLFLLLKQLKKLKVSEIMFAFDIDLKKAEEWCKILEEHELGKIYYPAFGETELKWKEK